MYRLFIPFLLFCLCLTLPAGAQQLTHRQGELIVQFGADVDAKEWIAAKDELTAVVPLGQSLNTYLVRFDFTRYAATDLRQRYGQDPAVIAVQLNHFITLRRRPNDQRYPDQWQHRNLGQINGVIGADHNIEAAWDVTTGGVTANGDTIVVAVLDDGIDLDHQDLVANIWRNHDEIPNNGVDDDNNGYVDDYHGYDTASDDPDVNAGNSDDHGTPVCGIIGAVGNNSIGVSGMNWRVKIMMIRNAFLDSEAEVLQAYSYALEARERYNATNGAQGAYVAVTNASWGTDFGNADDSPIWCNLYDRLGQAGILNIGATINGNVNVELEGDLPTNCPSEYLIGVTNVDTRDQKVREAGFGNVSIDLGAFGEEAFTTDLGNNYGYFGGTSSATPHVAGAAALLYAAPCASFAQLLAVDPAAAALTVREVLLSTVKPNASLAGITVTGGRMDVGAAMAELMSRCSDCLAPTSFTAVSAPGSATSITVDWRSIADITTLHLRYRPIGTTEWSTVTNPSPPYLLNNLPNCTGYEVQLTGACGNKAVETRILSVFTDGCCTIPNDFSVVAAANQLFVASWTPLLAGRSYRLRYRQAGTDNWTTRTAGPTQNQLGIAGGILPCTDYQFEFQTNCDTFLTDFGQRMTVRSTGCGACQEATYCEPDRYDNSREWIAEVNLGNVLVKTSGRQPNGYTSFGEVTAQPFVRGGVYPIQLRPGFPQGTESEAFRVYIDWDQNGVFASTEIAAEAVSTAGGVATADITVPVTAALRSTRMRVIMQFRSIRGGPCSDNEDGEVEDYCISIVEASGCPPPTQLRADYNRTTEDTRLDWSASAAPGGSYRLRYRLRGTADAWTETDVTGISLTIPDLNLCGAYEVEVASLCGGSPGPFQLFYFLDNCTDTDTPSLEASEWSVSPNPTAGPLRIEWPSTVRAAELIVLNVDGRRMRSLPPGNSGQTSLDLSDLPAGVYLLELRLEDGRRGIRRVVVR